jgi:GNAT superfamily N-acetyltransferase
MTKPLLTNGYHPLGPGQIANVVTLLEMKARPTSRAVPPHEDLSLRPLDKSDSDGYLSLFRKVGGGWMWFSRLAMPRNELETILRHPDVGLFALEQAGQDIGILELDFRRQPDCELAFFGVTPDAIGKGAGRYLMSEAISRAWAGPITRFWVHTCSFDHPAAIDFYKRSGFTPYQFMVEVLDDPRLTGLLPRDAAPHVALIDP